MPFGNATNTPQWLRGAALPEPSVQPGARAARVCRAGESAGCWRPALPPRGSIAALRDWVRADKLSLASYSAAVNQRSYPSETYNEPTHFNLTNILLLSFFRAVIFFFPSKMLPVVFFPLILFSFFFSITWILRLNWMKLLKDMAWKKMTSFSYAMENHGIWIQMTRLKTETVSVPSVSPIWFELEINTTILT